MLPKNLGFLIPAKYEALLLSCRVGLGNILVLACLVNLLTKQCNMGDELNNLLQSPHPHPRWFLLTNLLCAIPLNLLNFYLELLLAVTLNR